MERKFWIIGLFIYLSMTLIYARKTTFNVQGGLNFTNYSISEGNSPKLGFRAGVGVAIEVNDFFFIEPSLFMLTKGAKLGPKGYFGSVTINPLYVQFPVQFTFKYPTTEKFSMFVNAGPYIAYGISGKAAIKSEELRHMTLSHTIDLFKKYEVLDNKSFLKKIDAGIMAGLGMEFSHMFFLIGADIGVIEVTDFTKFVQRDNDVKIRNIGLHIATGFRF